MKQFTKTLTKLAPKFRGGGYILLVLALLLIYDEACNKADIRNTLFNIDNETPKINNLKSSSQIYMNIEAYKEHTKMKTISSNYVSTMTLPQQRYLLTARKQKINQALLWDSSIEYNENGNHFLVVKMKIPKTTFFKDYDDNRYIVFYDSNGHLVAYIYELWARKSASNPQNYYSTVKDVFLCNKLNLKTKSTDFDGYVFVYNNDYRQIGSYDVKHKKLSVSNIKALLDFNEKKGSVDSSSLNFIKKPKISNLLSLPKTNASYYCIEYRATWVTAGDEVILNIVYFWVCYPNCQSIAPHKPGDFSNFV